MSTATASVVIHAASEDVFDLIHNYSRRLEWDTFLREARLLSDAQAAGLGVSSRCVARWTVGGLGMDTVYITFERPAVAAVRMTRGPFFLRSFAASIRQDRLDDKRTRVTYRYNLQSQPRCLAFLMQPIVRWVFQRETQRRLEALKRFLEAGR